MLGMDLLVGPNFRTLPCRLHIGLVMAGPPLSQHFPDHFLATAGPKSYMKQPFPSSAVAPFLLLNDMFVSGRKLSKM